MALKSLVSMVVLAVLSIAFVEEASARQGGFEKRHPRRAQVNRREVHQQQRIAQGVKSGSLSPSEAAQLEQQAAAIRQQQRAAVKANGGYLTKEQQKQLNKELNQQSKDIYQEKHD